MDAIVAVVTYPDECPVHDYEYSTSERTCSCRIAYLSANESYNYLKVDVIWTVERSSCSYNEAVAKYRGEGL